MVYKGSELVFTSKIALYLSERCKPHAGGEVGEIGIGAVNLELTQFQP